MEAMIVLLLIVAIHSPPMQIALGAFVVWLLGRSFAHRGERHHKARRAVEDALDVAKREAEAMRADGITKATRWHSFAERHARRLVKLGLARSDALLAIASAAV